MAQGYPNSDPWGHLRPEYPALFWKGQACRSAPPELLGAQQHASELSSACLPWARASRPCQE